MRSPLSDRERDTLQTWVASFLWEFADSGMSNGEAAEIIVATLETQIAGEPSSGSRQSVEPAEIFRAWQIQQG